MTFNIITLGCKVNAYESEMMKELLLKDGYKEESIHPDIVIINTCSVTNMADSKSKKMVRRFKRENPDTILVVCGCSSQNNQSIYEEMDISILLGNKDKSKIVSILNEYLQTKKRYTKFYNEKLYEFENMKVDQFTSHTRAFVKIQDGCNNYCSYCIIPYVRGNIRSKDFKEAVDEIKTLVDNHHQEIVLTGINTGAYGEGTPYDLTDLIQEISKIENLKRIRISSIEITELNDKFLNELKNNPKICDHLHIPLQAGSDPILKKMNRKYDLNTYFKKIEEIRKIRPQINISTDVIVGHPYETEDLFATTINTCQKLKFAKIHVFPYSKRDGTPSSRMEYQVSEEEKKRRSKSLIALSNTLEKEYAHLFLGKEVEVLIEEQFENKSVGHTSNYLKIEVEKKLKPNTFYKVTVDEKNLKIND